MFFGRDKNSSFPPNEGLTSSGGLPLEVAGSEIREGLDQGDITPEITSSEGGKVISGKGA